ncbi:hypothetical protein MMC25_005211 [Agyrium rufum]|nr:hypothetical protein [Agyrium rufum]
MPILIRPVKEADLPCVVDIQFAAFAHSPYVQIMNPPGTPSRPRHLAALKRAQEELATDPHFFCWVAEEVDGVKGEDAAAAALTPDAAADAAAAPGTAIVTPTLSLVRAEAEAGSAARIGESVQGVEGAATEEVEEAKGTTDDEDDASLDTSGSKVVGFTRWREFKEDRPREEWDVVKPREHVATGVNNEAADAFYYGLMEGRRKVMGGRKHVLINFLDIAPGHQRRGIGSVLLKHVLSIADDLGLESYLEATPEGEGLYRKLGFEHVDTLTFPREPFGGQGSEVFKQMIRPVRRKE